MPGKSMLACSWIPIPFRMIRKEPSLKAPEQVTSCRERQGFQTPPGLGPHAEAQHAHRLHLDPRTLPGELGLRMQARRSLQRPDRTGSTSRSKKQRLLLLTSHAPSPSTPGPVYWEDHRPWNQTHLPFSSCATLDAFQNLSQPF